ncbi:unnamed protein product [Protopolystoma xenopodis]|uniref:Uncharacterized protein n=1 Tax=Protopolystoma xenopodis TaxID=117903 RepID=A0A3S5AZA1_9PLAT|nr:unnamed protein product [Protopolystoma xenopodis]
MSRLDPVTIIADMRTDLMSDPDDAGQDEQDEEITSDVGELTLSLASAEKLMNLSDEEEAHAREEEERENWQNDVSLRQTAKGFEVVDGMQMTEDSGSTDMTASPPQKFHSKQLSSARQSGEQTTEEKAKEIQGSLLLLATGIRLRKKAERLETRAKSELKRVSKTTSFVHLLYNQYYSFSRTPVAVGYRPNYAILLVVSCAIYVQSLLNPQPFEFTNGSSFEQYSDVATMGC